MLMRGALLFIASLQLILLTSKKELLAMARSLEPLLVPILRRRVGDVIIRKGLRRHIAVFQIRGRRIFVCNPQRRHTEVLGRSVILILINIIRIKRRLIWEVV